MKRPGMADTEAAEKAEADWVGMCSDDGEEAVGESATASAERSADAASCCMA